MTGTTTAYALPYPETTDPPDGAAQIKALAEAVDTVLATLATRGKGVVASVVVGTSSDIGTTETITASATFNAEAGRAYRVSLTTPVLDNQASASQTAIVTLRHAAGATVTSAGTIIAKAVRNTPATTASTSAGSAAETATAVGWINGAAAGQRTVGVGLAAASASSNVRFLAGSTIGPDITPTLVVEDVGPAF